MNKIYLWLAILGIILMNGCTTNIKTPADIYKDKTANELFDSAEKSLVKASYQDTIDKLEALDALYPFNQHQQQAQLDIIYAYYKAREFPASAAAATRYMHLYPRSENIDYAYYMKGMADYSENRGFATKFVKLDLSKRDIGSTKEAFNDFAELLKRFPHSKYAPDARGRMIYLRNLMAQYELNIGQFYYDRGAYVAAANRGNFIVQHYQQAPQIVPALGLMVNAYRRLGLPQSADETLKVLAHNYPDSQVYQNLIQTKS